jgi:two-component sensor histidine kinase
MKAPQHPDESLRLDALYRLEILDTAKEKEFDDIVDVVASFCGTPVSLISLVDADRQWFKAAVGMDVRETPIESSMCAHTILQSDVLEVPDTLGDPRFADNPLVVGDPGLRFYAGAVLESDDGLPLGTICVLDYKPRELTPEQRKLLTVMARQVTARLSLRRALKIEREVTASLANTLLEQGNLLSQNEILRQEIDHRVKNSLHMVASFLAMQGRKSDNAAVKVQLAEAHGRVLAIAEVHDQLHRSGQSDQVPVKTFLEGLCLSLGETRPAFIDGVNVEADDVMLPVDQVMALGLAASELIANAFKHAYSEDQGGGVHVSFTSRQGEGILTVRDEGAGLPEGFEGDAGTGLGMKVLATLVSRLGGTVDHGAGEEGGRFTIRFPLKEQSVT